MAVSYIEHVRRRFPNVPPYQWDESTDVPFAALQKPLNEARIALLSTGGVYLKDQQAFKPDKNDLTYRKISKDTDPRDLLISHDSYDHSGAKKDINSVLPYQRLQELEDEGVIGELSQQSYTLMGRIFKKTTLLDEIIPAIIGELRDEKVDAAFLVPV